MLWVAVARFIFGSEVAGSHAVAELVSKFSLDRLPTPAWYAAAVLGTFLLGSLLVIEGDPHKLASQWVRFRVAGFVDRFEPDLSPSAGMARAALASSGGCGTPRPLTRSSESGTKSEKVVGTTQLLWGG